MKRVFLALVAAAMIAPASADAEVLLTVDLSVMNEITITATAGLSDVTVAGGDGIGFYLEDFFPAAFGVSGDTLVSGDLTSANDVSDGTPDLFSFTGDAGLNMFSYTDTLDSSFTAGAVAFSGSGTWTLTADAYAGALAGGNRSGDIWFEADDILDLATASVIGQFSVTTSAIPEPGSLALLGMMGVACIARRRRA